MVLQKTLETVRIHKYYKRHFHNK